MTIRWEIPNDEIHLDELDVAPPIVYDGIDEEHGQQTRNRVMQWYFTD